MDNRTHLYIISGSHNRDVLQNALDRFIERFVLCSECDNPETKLVRIEEILNKLNMIEHYSRQYVIKKLMNFGKNVRLVVTPVQIIWHHIN